MPKKTFLRLDSEKQERVVRCAINEFVNNGFEKAKVSEIARDAEVAKGSIYQYFENKKELFLYCIQWTLEFFMAMINDHTTLQNTDVFDYLLKDGRERFELAKKESMLVRFSLDFSSGKYGELTKTINEEIWKIGDAYILEMIQVGKDRGTIRPELDDQVLLLFYKGVTAKIEELFLAMFEKNGLEFSEEQFRNLETTITQLTDLLKNGMGT